MKLSYTLSSQRQCKCNVLNPFNFKKMAVFHRVKDGQHGMGGF